MVKPLDVEELERQVNSAISNPPGPVVEQALREAGKQLPLEDFRDIIDREVADREDRFPEDEGVIQRLHRLQERIDAALGKL